jgi:histidyl-tRNA synthetase
MSKSALRDRDITDQLIGVVEHYGFVRASDTEVYKKKSSKKLRDKTQIKRELDNPSPLSFFVRNLKVTPEPAPAMLYTVIPSSSSATPSILQDNNSSANIRTSNVTTHLELIITGLKDGLAETILMHVGKSILSELGAKKYSVTINSMGDKDSAIRFSREFSSFARKRINTFGKCCRRELKNDLLKMVRCCNRDCIRAKMKAPKPIDFLTEHGRRHFKQVLEHMESLYIPYKIDEWFIDSNQNLLKVFFCLNNEDIDGIDIYGGRYGNLNKLLGLRRDMAISGISVVIKKQPNLINIHNNKIETHKPKVYIIQLGVEARKIGLIALEQLRLAKIPAMQNINCPKLTDHVCFAEERNIPYIVIIGHKEALEGAVIVRTTESRSQKTIPLTELATIIKQSSTLKL